MDDSRIPWWLVLLVGIGVTGLAVWQSARWKLPIRLGAGALAMLYLVLLAIAVGGDPRGMATARTGSLKEVLTTLLGGLSVTSAVLLSGRPAFRGQLVWFGLMSLANAGICFAWETVGIASLLVIAGFTSLVLLVKECRSGGPLKSSDCWPRPPFEPAGSPSNPVDESLHVSVLAGAVGLVLGVALIGTSYFALHTESTRATMTRRHSALPSRTRVRSVLDIRPDVERSIPAIELAFGRRADVVVLLAVLAFVALAASTSTHLAPAPVPSGDSASGSNPPDSEAQTDPMTQTNSVASTR
jgi:hypothetical protein